MRFSIKRLMNSLKEKKILYNNFDPEILESYLDAGGDNFLNLSDIWLWFPASPDSLGWYRKKRNLYFIDRDEFVLYIFYMRESENIYRKYKELIYIVKLTLKLCKDFPKILVQELTNKIDFSKFDISLLDLPNNKKE